MARAKRIPKETNVPLIFALVFFVLTTIAGWVMWYMQFSDQQAKDTAVANAKKDVAAANAVARDAENKAKLYRIVLGIDEGDERNTLQAEHKPGDVIAKEMKRIQDKIVEKAK